MVKIPVALWESELWSHINTGDGSICPLVETCQDKATCGFCCPDNYKIFNALNSRDLNLAKSIEGFPWNVRPGRIFQLIEMLATQYLEKARLYQPPVSDELIHHMGISKPIEISKLPLKNHHGAVWDLGDFWLIQLKESDVPSMQRLTIFHEGFHIIARTKAIPVFHRLGSNEGLFNEILADYFADSIQMPREWLRKKWLAVHNFNQMLEIFQVTPLSMMLRLKDCHLI
jgi:hypothetical protein